MNCDKQSVAHLPPLNPMIMPFPISNQLANTIIDIPKEIQTILDASNLSQQKNQENRSNSNRVYATKYLLKDSFWRPILRLFRRYFKFEALPVQTYKNIRLEPLSDQGGLLCREIGLPDELANLPNAPLALLMICNSHSIIRHQRLKPEAKTLMGRQAGVIVTSYYQVFNENNKRSRKAFF